MISTIASQSDGSRLEESRMSGREDRPGNGSRCCPCSEHRRERALSHAPRDQPRRDLQSDAGRPLPRSRRGSPPCHPVRSNRHLPSRPALNLNSATPNQYSEADAAFLQEVANQVALAVENMKAYEEITSLNRPGGGRRRALAHPPRGQQRHHLEPDPGGALPG